MGSLVAPAGFRLDGSGAATSSSAGESEAGRLFLAAVLEGDADLVRDIESLCRSHPQHASERRLLHASCMRTRAPPRRSAFATWPDRACYIVT